LRLSSLNSSILPKLQSLSLNTALAVLCLFFQFTFAAIRADIDAIDSRVQWSGTAALKLGELWRIGGFRTGGFIEIRDDSRFNRAILPNHNWRGYALAGYDVPLWVHDSSLFELPIEFHHESAHATMGIEEPTDNAYEKIYDGTYRNVNRNAFCTGLNLRYGKRFRTTLDLRVLQYWKSRNTPEASNTKLGTGNALTAGSSWSAPLTALTPSSWRLTVSSFVRKEFSGNTRYATQLYVGDSLLTAPYAVIQNTVSLSGMLALDRALDCTVGEIGLFVQAIYGNAGGFQDSREQIKTFAGGLTIHR